MIKRFVIMLMALLLAFGMVCSVAVADDAEPVDTRYTPNNPYELHCDEKETDTWVYAQFSPFVPELTKSGWIQYHFWFKKYRDRKSG